MLQERQCPRNVRNPPLWYTGSINQWDGVRSTSYELLDTKYNKLYTIFSVDIRPSMVNEVKMMHQGKQVLKLENLKPDQNGKSCNFIKFENVPSS